MTGPWRDLLAESLVVGSLTGGLVAALEGSGGSRILEGAALFRLLFTVLRAPVRVAQLRHHRRGEHPGNT